MGVAHLSGIDVVAVRSQFPALSNYVWFQNGGVSITPEPIAREHIRLMEELLERGPMHIIYPEEEYPRRTASIARLARFFEVDADELALMRGVSEAFQTVLRGIDWQTGDRIVISDDEEAALLLASLSLRDRHGIEVVKLPLEEDESLLLERAEAALTPSTRLLALSHVTTDMGFRYPASSLCALARNRGIPSFLDLAHSTGVVTCGLRDLGCDFAGLLSYKWMYSPYAAGLLWVRRERIGDLAVTYAGGRSEKSLDFCKDRYELHDSAQRFQFGPWSWPLVHAWTTAVDWLAAIGSEAIWERTQALTHRLKEGLARIEGTELYTPHGSGSSAALVSFGLDGWTGQHLVQTLRDRWNIVIKPLPHTKEGLRASIPFFLLEEEIDLLLHALQELQRNPRPCP